AATERLARLAEQEETEQRAQAEQHAAQLENERVQIEHHRARALAKLRLAQTRLAEFHMPTPLQGAAPDGNSSELATQLISLQEHLPLYESALASVASLAAHAYDVASQERMQHELERTLERARNELTQAQATLALLERDVQAAQQSVINARKEHERAERERQKERERAHWERQRELERTRAQFQTEREKITRERERIAREQEQLLHEHERLQQERAREQARERERQQREQQRERERAERERAQAQERLARERERTANEQAAKAARVSSFASQLETIRAQLGTAQFQVAEMRAALQNLNAIASPHETALLESERLQNELEEREAQLRSGLTVAEELYNRAVLDAEGRRAEIARLEQEIED